MSQDNPFSNKNLKPTVLTPEQLRARQIEQAAIHQAAINAALRQGRQAPMHASTPVPTPDPSKQDDPRHKPAVPVNLTAGLRVADGALGGEVTHKALSQDEENQRIIDERIRLAKMERSARLSKLVETQVEEEMQNGTRTVTVEVKDDSNIEEYLKTTTRPVMVLFTLLSCVGCIEMKKTALPAIVRQWYKEIDFVEFRCTASTLFDKVDKADVDRHPTAMLFYKGMERGICHGTSNAPYWNDEINKHAHLINVSRKTWQA